MYRYKILFVNNTNMEADIQFNNTFSKYLSARDKFDSLYIFVINKLSVEDCYEKISKMITIIDSMSDIKKKSYLKSRLHNFREYFKTNYKAENIISEIFMVSDVIECESLISYHYETLQMFSHNKISYQYGSEYPIEWLKKLLLDREYINVIKIKNNDISHTKMNSTKKTNIYTETIKSMDLAKIVSERIQKGEKYVIHGVSAVLKNYVDKNALAVSTCELSDEKILKLLDNSLNIKNHIELNDILNKLLDPKMENKIVFGKDIKLSIKNGLLKVLFCTETIHKKISTIPKELQNFEIKIIRQIEKGDIADKLDKDYSGAVGVKYY
jgi:hypothetical protein